MSDYTEHAHEMYLERVRATAQRLRDAADELERRGLDVQDHGGVMPSFAGDPHVHAASKAVHAAVWGFTNANLDSIVAEAGRADRAVRDAVKDQS